MSEQKLPISEKSFNDILDNHEKLAYQRGFDEAKEIALRVCQKFFDSQPDAGPTESRVTAASLKAAIRRALERKP